MYNLFALFLASSGGFNSTGYASLQDQSWEYCVENNFEKQNLAVNYRFCSQGNISNSLVVNTVEKASNKVLKFAKINGFKNSQCISNNKLEIYDVRFDILNQKERFENYNFNNQAIWALYDPRIQEEGVSSIMISDQGEYWDELILAHEMAHYWYDRFCWNKYWNKSNEDFALEFEKFYLQKGTK